MEAIYRRVEDGFRALARLVYRHSILYITLVLFASLGMSSQLGKLTLDTSNEGFFYPDSAIVHDYNSFREQFGREDSVYITIAAGTVFEESFLRRLQSFHRDLEDSVPHLDEVTSLLNARNTRGEGDELIVEDLFEHWPENAQELAAIEQRAMANPIYRDLLLSRDGKVTAVAVRASPWPLEEVEEDALAGFDLGETATTEGDKARPFLDGSQNREFVEAVEAVVAQYQSEDFPLAVSGVPVITESIKKSMVRDLGRFVLSALVIAIVLLAVIFRRVSGVALPLLVIILTLLSTLGLMGITGTAFKVQTQTLPSFLMAVSIASAVHILSQFYHYYDIGESRESAVVNAMGHSGAPVLGAGLTTAIGMMSFSNAGLAPIASLGVFAGIGILVSILYSLLLIPAMLALLPLRRRTRADNSDDLISRLLEAIANFSINYARQIIVCCLLATLVAAWAISKLTFYHDPLDWFPEGTPVRSDTYFINEQMNGVQNFEVVLDTGRENGLYEPAVLNAMESLSVALQDFEAGGMVSGKSLSLADTIKEINLALNGDAPAFYRIPQDRQLVAQELLLFENTGTDDLEEMVDSQFSKARFSIKLPWTDATSMEQYMLALEGLVREEMPGNVTFNITGMSTLYGHILHLSKTSMTESYMIAALIISLLMIVFIGNLRLGLVAMIPNLSPVFISLAVMAVLEIPLNVFTMFIGSIALGLAVDDTLHFLHGFSRYHQRTGDTREAIRMTFRSTGRALIVTTVALASGFLVFGLATMEAVRNFGLFTALAICLALFADFILTPAILVVMIKDRKPVPEAETLEETAT